MTCHWKDADRQSHPQHPADRPYRLCRLDERGQLSFYWGKKPGAYAAYVGKNYDSVWGTLACASGKKMKSENRIFIADYKTAKQIQSAGVCRPCGHCNKAEYQQWKSAKAPKARKSLRAPQA